VVLGSLAPVTGIFAMDMPVKHKKPSIAAQAAAREARLPPSCPKT